MSMKQMRKKQNGLRKVKGAEMVLHKSRKWKTSIEKLRWWSETEERVVQRKLTWELSLVLSWELSLALSWELSPALSWELSLALRWELSLALSWDLILALSWKLSLALSWELNLALSWELSLAERRDPVWKIGAVPELCEITHQKSKSG